MRWGGRLGGRRDQERQEDQQQRVSWILRMLTSSGGASAEVTINNHTLTGEPSTTVPMWKEEGDVVDVPTGQDRQAPAEDGGGGKMASGVVWSRLYIRVHGGSRDSTSHPRGSSSTRCSRGPQPSSLRVTQQGLPEDTSP